jgi:hypothetical protein
MNIIILECKIEQKIDEPLNTPSIPPQKDFFSI